MDLRTKPDFDQCMERIYAWYEQRMLDRPPVRFHRHNTEFEQVDDNLDSWGSLRERWFDADYQVDRFRREIAGMRFNAETFPIYWPNLGPDVYAAFLGVPLEYGETTSWSHPIVTDLRDLSKVQFDPQNEYFQGILNLTETALRHAGGEFIVGYTDLHPGVDCAAALRGSTNLCMDFYDDPEGIPPLLDAAVRDFDWIFNRFHELLKEHGQPSVSWMHVPSFETMHIPSADFSSLISSDLFNEYCLPIHRRETALATHNVYHVDGPDVARHLDSILEMDDVNAIQWVQGVGDDYPIMQWIDLIRRVQDAGTSVIVDLHKDDLAEFMKVMDPRGLFLWIATESEEEEHEIIRSLGQWARSSSS